jgi:hypothetical protein
LGREGAASTVRLTNVSSGAIYQSARDGDATLLISHSRLTDNQAVGGAAGAGGKGGMGLGGAIENLDNTTTPGLHSAHNPFHGLSVNRRTPESEESLLPHPFRAGRC